MVERSTEIFIECIPYSYLVVQIFSKASKYVILFECNRDILSVKGTRFFLPV